MKGNDEHEKRLETGLAVVLALAVSMGILQVLWWVGTGGPEGGTILQWEVAAIAAISLWIAIYLTGWLFHEGLPLLANRYRMWAKGETDDRVL